MAAACWQPQQPLPTLALDDMLPLGHLLGADMLLPCSVLAPRQDTPPIPLLLPPAIALQLACMQLACRVRSALHGSGNADAGSSGTVTSPEGDRPHQQQLPISRLLGTGLLAGQPVECCPQTQPQPGTSAAEQAAAGGLAGTLTASGGVLCGCSACRGAVEVSASVFVEHTGGQGGSEETLDGGGILLVRLGLSLKVTAGCSVGSGARGMGAGASVEGAWQGLRLSRGGGGGGGRVGRCNCACDGGLAPRPIRP